MDFQSQQTLLSVEMIATGIVYVKDTRTDTYQPFISSNGKYCRYDKGKGILVEI